MKKLIATAAAVVLLVGVAVTAFAHEVRLPISSPGDGTLAPPRVDRPGKHGFAERTRKRQRARSEYRLLHSDGVAMKRDGSTVQVRAQTGIIQQVDSDSITLKSPDGYIATYKIDESTKIFQKGEEASAGDLEAGEGAKVFAVKEASAYTAKRINSAGKPGPRVEHSPARG